MPQLDIYSFNCQVSWFLFIFFVFFVVCHKNIIPQICFILKVRFKKLAWSALFIKSFYLEYNDLLLKYDNTLLFSSTKLKSFISGQTTFLCSWVDRFIRGSVNSLVGDQVLSLYLGVFVSSYCFSFFLKELRLFFIKA